MRKLSFSKGKFARFISSKGFYTAIAVCLAGAGAATWLAVNQTISSIEDSNRRMLDSASSFAGFPILEEVEKKQPDIPKVSEPSSSLPTPSSAPEFSSAPEEPVKSVVAPPPLQMPVYTWPVNGDVVNPYSNGELVKNVTLNDWRTHDGVDIFAEKGSEILASAAGSVKEIRYDPLWGTVLVLRHIDGNESYYFGLSEAIPVSTGEDVLARQSIGRLEGIPCELSDGTHLHFAMKQDGSWIDPLSLMSD